MPVARTISDEEDDPRACPLSRKPAPGSTRQLTLGGDKGFVRTNRLEAGQHPHNPAEVTQRSPFRYLKTSPEIIRLTGMLYVRYPLSLRKVEDLLYERGLDTV